MNSVSSQVSTDGLTDVLGSVRQKGVRLWSENGRLHYQAPKGVLTQEEIERLRVSKGQIVALLERANGEQTLEPRLELRPRHDRAPLTFSQLAHWHLYRLYERRSNRLVTSAMRLHGRLSINAFREGLAEIVRRHEALRTRIGVLDGVPIQEIDESGNCELEVDDLTALSERFRELAVERQVEQFIMEPIDVTVGPLFGVRLLKLRENEHVLIVAMEHLISDGSSLNILTRDLFVAYMQALKGDDFSLPDIPMQFADYAVWQVNAQKSWIEKHGAYWNERLAGCQRTRFPDDESSQTAAHSGWGAVSIRIGKDLKAELREWCRLRQTTLVMSVFTAYVGLVLRWCNASDSVIQYQSNGRVSTKIENTIGYFTSALSLRLALREDDSLVDLKNRITGEYCNACEHADFSYLAAQLPRPEFTRNTVFNWSPRGSKLDISGTEGSNAAITWSPIRIAYPTSWNLESDGEPCILLFDSDDEIVGDVYFPLHRFSVETMERFARNFQVFIRALLGRPDGRVKDILLCK